jgi:Fe-S-cluster-containing hydrogenase component 2
MKPSLFMFRYLAFVGLIEKPKKRWSLLCDHCDLRECSAPCASVCPGD